MVRQLLTVGDDASFALVVADQVVVVRGPALLLLFLLESHNQVHRHDLLLREVLAVAALPVAEGSVAALLQPRCLHFLARLDDYFYPFADRIGPHLQFQGR